MKNYIFTSHVASVTPAKLSGKMVWLAQWSGGLEGRGSNVCYICNHQGSRVPIPGRVKTITNAHVNQGGRMGGRGGGVGGV